MAAALDEAGGWLLEEAEEEIDEEKVTFLRATREKNDGVWQICIWVYLCRGLLLC